MNLRTSVESWIRRLTAQTAETEAHTSLRSDDREVARLLVSPSIPSGLSRRGFLGAVMGTAAGAALASQVDLEQLLWTPSETAIFLPPPPPVTLASMAEMDSAVLQAKEQGNAFVRLDWMTQEILKEIERNLVFTGREAKRAHQDVGVLGMSVLVREPARWTVCQGQVVPAAKVVTMTDQLGMSMSTPMNYRQSRGEAECYVKAAGRDLAARVKAKGLTEFAVLKHPGYPCAASVVVESHTSGLSVRGMEAYDVKHNRTELRFDLLGGKG